jgi:predicted Rossmann-fold nucleotide-binding protein
MVAAGTIAQNDLHLLLFTDSVDEAMNHIEKYAVEKFGLVRKKMPRATRELAEKVIQKAKS